MAPRKRGKKSKGNTPLTIKNANLKKENRDTVKIQMIKTDVPLTMPNFISIEFK